MVTVLLVGGAWCMAACNPYKCGTDARSATYVGLLGHSAPPVLPVAETDSGRVFLMLNEWRGSMSQQNVIASVAIRGFVSRVSEIHVHEGAPANPGRLLLRSVSGDRKSTRLNSSHRTISYAVFCLKKKKNISV